MIQKTTLFGSHIFIAPQGDAIGTPASSIPVGQAVVGKLAKPGGADSAWLNLGAIEKVDVEATTEKIEVTGASPGKIVVTDIVETKGKLVLKADAVECSNYMFELMWKTKRIQPGASAVQYTPLGGGTKRAWVKLQQYDQDGDALLNTADIWCHVSLGSVSMGTDKVTFSLELTALFSPYNTGRLE